MLAESAGDERLFLVTQACGELINFYAITTRSGKFQTCLKSGHRLVKLIDQVRLIELKEGIGDVARDFTLTTNDR